MTIIIEGHHESFVCCDTKISNEVDSYLNNDTVNCIPYNCADIENNCMHSQYRGSMEIMKCYYHYTTYQYPKVVASSELTSIGLEYGKTRFECCMEAVSMNKFVLVSYMDVQYGRY
jgi:hypothetical protein